MTRFETIGNATLITYEGKNPLLATDIWLDEDSCYFGSWRLSHIIPEKQRVALSQVKYIYISHSHPDHLNIPSLRHYKKAKIILAQHYGGRVEKDLRRLGFDVISLPSKKWISIGNKTKIMLFNNEKQDSAILVELTDDAGNKSLIINLNDSGAYGFAREAAYISSKYRNSFYLALHGWGDADMINFYTEEGIRVLPNASKRDPVGKSIMRNMTKFNANIAIPFSSFHQYQRRDSFWANKYATPVDQYSNGFIHSPDKLLLPPFQEIYLNDGCFKAINISPPKNEIIEPLHESIFGDDWSLPLNDKEITTCRDYFKSISTINKDFKRISFKVGGKKFFVLENGSGKTSINFEVPKSSLMKSIRNEIFDDLLIGNLMKTTLYYANSLYDPDFARRVAKYADNGRTKNPKDLKKYLSYYYKNRSINDQFDVLRSDLTWKVKARFRSLIGDSLFNFFKKLIVK